jgi:hypothetical protein
MLRSGMRLLGASGGLTMQGMGAPVAAERRRSIVCGQETLSLLARRKSPEFFIVWLVFGGFGRPQHDKFALILLDDLS